MGKKEPATAQEAAAPPGGWQWLTKQEVAEYLGVTIGWVDLKTAEGVVPHYKFGHYVRYLRDDLDAYIAQSRRVGR
jgi:excisionase family DNA binding protein